MNNQQEKIVVLGYLKAEHPQVSGVFQASFSPVWTRWKNIGNIGNVHFLNQYLAAEARYVFLIYLHIYFCILNQLLHICQSFGLHN